MESYLGKYSDYIYALMRIFVGLLFSCNGARTLFGAFGGVDGAGASAELFTLFWFAGVIEFFCGILVALGLLTGYAAFLASGEMAFAYFLGHFPKGFWPIMNTGERAVFYCFTFLFIASRGAAVWGLDRVFRR
jgi:putative oxidoreductase